MNRQTNFGLRLTVWTTSPILVVAVVVQGTWPDASPTKEILLPEVTLGRLLFVLAVQLVVLAVLLIAAGVQWIRSRKARSRRQGS